MPIKFTRYLGVLLTIAFTLPACSTPVVPTTTPAIAAKTQTPAATAAAKPTPVSTSTAAPPRTLVVCLGQEPTTLYPYGSSARAMWSVLEAIYDGPIDQRGYNAQPVILEKIPVPGSSDTVVEAVEVKSGDEIVNSKGELIALTKGVTVIPSGCSGPDCAINWDGKTALKMDRLKLSYKLKSGVNWSDGKPVSAEDSVYSYLVAANPATPVSKRIIDRTTSYIAADSQTVVWTGKPGYLPTRLDSSFFMPLPRHAWEKISAADLLKSDESTKHPLGWGPYILEEWKSGDHIRLKKNPNYFRASEGLPKFDTLVYRFLGEPADNNLAALLVGECDVVDQTSLLVEQLEGVLELQKSRKLKAYVVQGPEWERIDFGIRPASYDNGYNPASGDRVDFFGDERTRQAFAYCADRQGIVDKTLFGQTSVPATFLLPTHPAFMTDLKAYAHDATTGRKLLDEVGWKDNDGNPQTPRQAAKVKNVPDGTKFTVNYLTTEASLRVSAAKILVQSWAECGLQVNVRYMKPDELYAPGPDGVLFGRKFDLAQLAWETGYQSPCYLYQSDQIPNENNHWLGVNLPGFTDSAYDKACQSASLAQTASSDYQARQSEVQRLFACSMPVIPLYFHIKMAITRTNLCGLEMGPMARSDLWNLEMFDNSPGCK
jgi:peptide/nickel transport system substrate-binding protein